MPVEQESFCQKLYLLREILKDAVNASSAAMKVPVPASGANGVEDHAVLLTALNLVRLSCEGATAAIESHQRRHKCQEGHATLAQVKLFNVSTERWEPVSAAVYGHPPYGALAYESSMKAPGEGWIVDRQQLEQKRHTGTRLHYTEAGLKLLREEGLEM